MLTYKHIMQKDWKYRCCKNCMYLHKDSYGHYICSHNNYAGGVLIHNINRHGMNCFSNPIVKPYNKG